jgi:translation elongation factor EF-4
VNGELRGLCAYVVLQHPVLVISSHTLHNAQLRLNDTCHPQLNHHGYLILACAADPDAAAEELESLCGAEHPALRLSAKTGVGLDTLLPAIIE